MFSFRKKIKRNASERSDENDNTVLYKELPKISSKSQKDGVSVADIQHSTDLDSNLLTMLMSTTLMMLLSTIGELPSMAEYKKILEHTKHCIDKQLQQLIATQRQREANTNEKSATHMHPEKQKNWQQRTCTKDLGYIKSLQPQHKLSLRGMRKQRKSLAPMQTLEQQRRSNEQKFRHLAQTQRLRLRRIYRKYNKLESDKDAIAKPVASETLPELQTVSAFEKYEQYHRELQRYQYQIRRIPELARQSRSYSPCPVETAANATNELPNDSNNEASAVVGIEVCNASREVTAELLAAAEKPFGSAAVWPESQAENDKSNLNIEATAAEVTTTTDETNASMDFNTLQILPSNSISSAGKCSSFETWAWLLMEDADATEENY